MRPVGEPIFKSDTSPAIRVLPVLRGAFRPLSSPVREVSGDPLFRPILPDPTFDFLIDSFAEIDAARSRGGRRLLWSLHDGDEGIFAEDVEKGGLCPFPDRASVSLGAEDE